MRNIKLTIEYDGKDFNGWQKQPNKLNIQGTIEEELYDVLCYVFCIANSYNINLEQCMYMKEKLNAEKYNRKSIFDIE